MDANKAIAAGIDHIVAWSYTRSKTDLLLNPGIVMSAAAASLNTDPSNVKTLMAPFV
jgi:hypothetical protein